MKYKQNQCLSGMEHHLGLFMFEMQEKKKTNFIKERAMKYK